MRFTVNGTPIVRTDETVQPYPMLEFQEDERLDGRFRLYCFVNRTVWYDDFPWDMWNTISDEEKTDCRRRFATYAFKKVAEAIAAELNLKVSIQEYTTHRSPKESDNA
jgi:hypothetical protein